MTLAYYNEIDPAAAEWLRWLIAEGHIANGWVDERSIVDVEPADLEGFTQVHFFAGIGGWSLAARLAGWPDDRPLWTGSCPCQPFSVAGKGGGVNDERHLWPHFFRLIRACRPAVVMGEQVAGAAGYGWFDGVGSDLAGEGYASRAVDVPSCAVDAPHIRQRLYWVALADANNDGLHRPEGDAPEPCSDRQNGGIHHGVHSRVGEGGNSAESSDQAEGRGRLRGPGESSGPAEQWAPSQSARPYVSASRAMQPHGNMADTAFERREKTLREPGDGAAADGEEPTDCVQRLRGPNGTFWSDHIWITCHDGKARRTQRGLSLLVDGIPGRVAAWRGFGNAINPVLAAEVIAALMDTEA